MIYQEKLRELDLFSLLKRKLRNNLIATLLYLREAIRKTEQGSSPECVLITHRQKSKAATGRFQSECKPKILQERSTWLLGNIALGNCESSADAGSQNSPEEHPEQWDAIEANPGLSTGWIRRFVEVLPFFLFD